MVKYLETQYGFPHQEAEYVDSSLGEIEKNLREITGHLQKVFIEGFGKQLGVEEKSKNDFVTPTDKLIEEMLGNWIKAKYPDHVLYGEEQRGPEVDEIPNWLWGIDPIDGSNNYQAGNPDASIVLSLRYKGIPVLASCQLPVRTGGGILEYAAIAGHGLTCNGNLVHSTKILELNHTVIVTSKLTSPKRMIIMSGDIWDQAAGIHMNMSSVYEACRVASGEFGAGIFYDNGVYEWPAMFLFAKEGGCIVGLLENPEAKVNLNSMGSKNLLIAGNMNLYKQVKKLVHLPPKLL